MPQLCAVPVNVGSIVRKWNRLHYTLSLICTRLLTFTPVGKAGLGRDMWTLEFSNITRVFYVRLFTLHELPWVDWPWQFFYIQELLYITCVALVKICFLLFYLRIFPSDRMRLVIKISILVTICFGLTFLFGFAFQCSPVSYNWNGWDGEHTGSCVKTNSLVVAAAAFNIVLDIWVIAMPIPRVLTLQASLHTKLQVVFMFSVGFLWVSPRFSAPENFERPVSKGLMFSF